ncbi:uncharacterized protein [Littorina saxatilis]|uniref:Fe2OG dioxygenase domain-containing protein n=1 Tax=Littorina saxatilis TaxID=31220 RepID=A0AAN9G9L6_9CAEN
MATLEIEREDVKLPQDQAKRLAFVLYNVLTPEECQKYIKDTEKKGYEKALVNTGFGRQQLMTDVRNSDRCIIDSIEEADKLWQRVKPFVPAEWNGHQVVGLNERLRFLRYDSGQYFKPHYDGEYRRENGERSYITLQLYLNEGFKGGSTTFLSRCQTERVEVVPRIGSVLIFQHDIYHEGSELKKGRKYAMRTDVMYQRKQPLGIK